MQGNREKYLETHLEIITYFSKSIFRRNTIDDILWDITSNCIKRLDFVDCVVYLLNGDRSALVQKAAYGAKDIEGVKVASPIEIPLGQGIVGSVAVSGKAELISDCSIDPRYIVDDDIRNSEICVPIIFEDEVIGVIDSEHPDKGFYTQEHLEILTSIATISANKIARTMIEEENEVLARFVDENPTPVLRINAHGKILNHNQAAERLFDFWHVENGSMGDKETVKWVTEVLKSGRALAREINNEDRDWSLLIVPIEEHAYANIYVSDITELKQAKQLAEKASRAKDEFLSIMSHEMRTPLNAILGVGTLLRHPQDDAKKLKLLDTLDFSGKNLLALINDVLDLAKIESGKITFEKLSFSLPETMKELRQSFEHRADESGNTIVLNLNTTLVNVIGDQNRLIQIVSNLISNAVKFTTNGNITIAVHSHEPGPGEYELEVEVSDSGIGIPEQKLDVIFDAFQQANTSTTRIHGGTGLGLSITKKLVELQGGTVRVNSTVGIGSRFAIKMPIEISEQMPSDSPLVSDRDLECLRGKSVLIVDDNPVNLLVAEEIVKKWGLKVHRATDGERAVETYQKYLPHVILMDLQMPVCDGIEATRRIRALSGDEAKVHIIAVTADAMERTKESAMEVGMNDLITKPFDPEELLKKMKTGILKRTHS